MPKQLFNLSDRVLLALILCLFLFSACKNPVDGTTKTEPEGQTENTWVEFTNLEQFPVTVYRDPQRQQIMAEVTANGTQRVSANPAPAGTAFYPTFHLNLFDMSAISIPYNGPAIITTIEANKTTSVPVPKLEAIENSFAYIKLENTSDVSLTLRQGDAEKSPLGGGSGIILSNMTAAFEITPGSASGYSIMRNTTTPIPFPASLTEFKWGFIYTFKYSGSSLTLSTTKSVLQNLPPAAPQNVRVETVSSSSVRIAWDEVYGATGYEVYRSTTEAGSYSNWGSVSETAFTDTSAYSSSDYYYRVSAVNGNKKGASSITVSTKTLIGPPGNLRVTDKSAFSVSLAWNAYSGADGYTIYRSDSQDGTYTKVNDNPVTETVFTDTELASSTAYYYKISVLLGGIEGELSAAVSSVTLMLAPGNVQVNGATTSSISLGWNVVSGAGGYNVYRCGSENGSYSKVNSSAVTDLSYSNTGLSSNTTYYYKVRAVTSGNVESEWSTAVSAATLMAAPGNLRVTALTADTVSLAWNTVSGTSGYNVYRSSTEAGTYSKINQSTVTTTTFTDTGLAASSDYYYKVCALTGSNAEGEWSAAVFASTAITAVPGSGLTEKLAWLQSNAVSNRLYEITVSTDENIGSQTLSYSGKTGINITLSGTGTMRSINLSSNGTLFTIDSGVTLILENNITLRGRSGNTGSVVRINTDGALLMNTGTKITGNSSSSYGGGVYNSGTFTMTGGEISGNSFSAYGGGVTNSGTFTMSGGKISGNSTSTSAGGGVSNSGTFTMTGGEISGNTSYSSGGVYNSGTFTMSGGKISGNSTSTSAGGGVYNSGTFTMTGGEISANTSTSSGGGVYAYVGTFRMSGGVIYGSSAATELKNTASSSGASLYKGGGTTQYGVFSGDSFYRSGDLSTSNDTIRIVSGNLQNN